MKKNIRRLLAGILSLVIAISCFGIVDFEVNAAGNVTVNGVTVYCDSSEWDGVSPVSPPTDGSWVVSGDSYYIGTCSAFCYFADTCMNGTNYSGKTIYLAGNLNMGGIGIESIGCSSSAYFVGTFDGLNHTISNYAFTLTQNNSGMFGYVAGGTVIKNLTVDGLTVSTGTTAYKGGLVGYASGYFYMENVHVTGNSTVQGGSQALGGLVGQACMGMSMINCSFTSSNVNAVQSSGASGGLVGICSSSDSTTTACTFTDCSFNGAIINTSGNMVGGIVGSVGFGGAAFTECTTAGTINGLENTGGIVGRCSKSAVTYNFVNCTNSATISASHYVGGIVGQVGVIGTVSGAVNFTDTINTGNITNASSNTGGLVGRSEVAVTAIRCYNTGILSDAGGSAGGLAGLVNTSVTVKYSYNTGNITTNGQQAGGLVGSSGSGGEILSSYSKANITSTYSNTEIKVGGLIGYGSTPITSCYSRGTLTADNGGNIGGLVGTHNNGEIKNSYFSGAIVSSTYNGTTGTGKNATIVGKLTAGTVTNCYGNSSLSSLTVIGYQAGGTTADCTNESTEVMTAYSMPATLDNRLHFGSDDIGSLNDNYPILKWQDTTLPSGSNPYSIISADGTSGFWAYTTAADTMSGVSQVAFPSWSSNGGQDDLSWQYGSLINGDRSNGTWSIYIERSSHILSSAGNVGDFINTQIYVYDEAFDPEDVNADGVEHSSVLTGTIENTFFTYITFCQNYNSSDTTVLKGTFAGIGKLADSSGNATDIYNTYGNVYGTAPTRAGYDFMGWGTGRSDVTYQHTATISTEATAMSLYAIWQPTSYTLTINPNGGVFSDLSAENKYVTQPSATTYTLPTNITKNGYTFSCWSVTDGVGSIENNVFTFGIGAATLTAQWTINQYTIDFKWNNATTEGSYQTLTDINYASAVNVPDPSISGFTFGGWYGTAECDGEQIYATFPSAMPAQSTVLYAKWVSGGYTVSYNANTGSGTMEASSHVYGTAKNLSANTFTKTGYHFTGWATSLSDANNGIVTFTDEQSVLNLAASGNYDLYAVWIPNTYNVVFVKNTGDATENYTKVFSYAGSSSYTIPMLVTIGFTNSGYTFNGWSTTPDGEVEIENGETITIATNTADGATFTYYAQWTTSSSRYTAEHYLMNLDGTSYTLSGDAQSRIGSTYATVEGTDIDLTFTGYTYNHCEPADGITITPDGNAIIRLYYKRNTVTMNFSANGETGYTIPANVTDAPVGSSTTLPATCTVDNETSLRKLLGWSTEANGAVEYACGSSYTFAMNTSGTVTMFAVWGANYYALRDLNTKITSELGLNNLTVHIPQDSTAEMSARENFIESTVTALETANETATSRLTAFNQTSQATVDGYTAELQAVYNQLELKRLTSFTCTDTSGETQTHDIEEWFAELQALYAPGTDIAAITGSSNFSEWANSTYTYNTLSTLRARMSVYAFSFAITSVRNGTYRIIDKVAFTNRIDRAVRAYYSLALNPASMESFMTVCNNFETENMELHGVPFLMSNYNEEGTVAISAYIVQIVSNTDYVTKSTKDGSVYTSMVSSLSFYDQALINGIPENMTYVGADNQTHTVTATSDMQYITSLTTQEHDALSLESGLWYLMGQLEVKDGNYNSVGEQLYRILQHYSNFNYDDGVDNSWLSVVPVDDDYTPIINYTRVNGFDWDWLNTVFLPSAVSTLRTYVTNLVWTYDIRNQADINTMASTLDVYLDALSMPKITFEEIEGREVDNIEETIGASFTFPMSTREGYVLDGWYEGYVSGTVSGEKHEVGSIGIMPNQDKTYYANWISDSVGPGLTVYENIEGMSEYLGVSSSFFKNYGSINYVYSSKNNFTYYCYTNSEKPVMIIAGADNISSGGVDYPVSVMTETGTSSKYAMLTPSFTKGVNSTVTYSIEIKDVAGNSAESTYLYGGNSDETSTGINNGQITICIDYHRPEEGNEITANMFNNSNSETINSDSWVSSLYMIRNSGGAMNWEWIQHSDSVYGANDPIYGKYTYNAETNTTENDYACFWYVLNSAGDDTDVIAKYADGGADEIMHTKFIENYDTYMSKSTVWASNTPTVQYQTPGANQYIYFHLLDRWGNYYDKVVKIPNIDASNPWTTHYSNTPDGTASIYENGGSGLTSVELFTYQYEAGEEYIESHRVSLESSVILRSTRDESFWTNSVNGITIYNSNTNQIRMQIAGITSPTAFSILVTDKAGSSSASTIKTDENGWLTLTISNVRISPTGEELEGTYELEFNGTTFSLMADMKGVVEVIPPENPQVGTIRDITIVAASDVDRIILTDINTDVRLTFNAETEGVTITIGDNGWNTWTVPVPITKTTNNYSLQARGEGGEWYDEAEYGLQGDEQGEVRPTSAVINVTTPETISINTSNTFIIETYNGTDMIRILNADNNVMYSYGRDAMNVTITEHVDGTATWAIDIVVRGDTVNYQINARLDGAWDSTPITLTGTTVIMPSDTPNLSVSPAGAIISASADEIPVGEVGYITIVTIGSVDRLKLTDTFESSKIYTLTNTTITVTANANGTLTWVIPVRMTSAGEISYTISARIGSMWEPATSTLTVTFFEE